MKSKADFSLRKIHKYFIFSSDNFHVNKYATIAGMIMIGLSFYSIGPVICNELNPICSTEHYYTILPIFLLVFGIGAVLLTLGLKSISLINLKSANR